jgi:hypothetical protein
VDVALSPAFHIRIYKTVPGDYNLSIEHAWVIYVGLHIRSSRLLLAAYLKDEDLIDI